METLAKAEVAAEATPVEQHLGATAEIEVAAN